jgi:nitrate reductase NapE component
MIKDYLTVGIYAIALVAFIAAIGFYVHYVWSDCLGENGFLTCARMLSK